LRRKAAGRRSLQCSHRQTAMALGFGARPGKFARTPSTDFARRPLFPGEGLMHNSGAMRSEMAEVYPNWSDVIASEAKQSIVPQSKNGLLRRFAPLAMTESTV
jgi:hypothetical protein